MFLPLSIFSLLLALATELRAVTEKDPDWQLQAALLNSQSQQGPVYVAKPNPSPPFQLRYENVRCMDEDNRVTKKRLSKGKSKGATDCQSRCTTDEQCNFYAFWKIKKYCETYQSCFFTAPDGNNIITVYKKLNECDLMFRKYQVDIAKEFNFDTVHFEGPRRNMACTCTTVRWMTCAIFISDKETTVESATVRMRLDPSRGADMLAPFEVVGSSSGGVHNNIVYVDRKQPILIDVDGSRRPPFGAEMHILEYNRCLNVDLCLEGTPGVPTWDTKQGFCPMLKEPFRSGDPVYILKSQIEDAESGKPIRCMSSSGIRTWSILHNGNPFQDPFLIAPPNATFLLVRDFELYWLFDSATLESGICSSKSGAGGKKSKSRRGGKKKQSLSPELQGEAGPSSLTDQLFPQSINEREQSLLRLSAGSNSPGPPTADISSPEKEPSDQELQALRFLDTVLSPRESDVLPISSADRESLQPGAPGSPLPAELEPPEAVQSGSQSPDTNPLLDEITRIQRKEVRKKKAVPSDFLPSREASPIPPEMQEQFADEGGWETVGKGKKRQTPRKETGGDSAGTSSAVVPPQSVENMLVQADPASELREPVSLDPVPLPKQYIAGDQPSPTRTDSDLVLQSNEELSPAVQNLFNVHDERIRYGRGERPAMEDASVQVDSPPPRPGPTFADASTMTDREDLSDVRGLSSTVSRERRPRKTWRRATIDAPYDEPEKVQASFRILHTNPFILTFSFIIFYICLYMTYHFFKHEEDNVYVTLR